ncbi:type II toxin-antitoxin system RelE/ParE family toxin [Paracoccus siganidrum]|uniref:type II toxin-antitoxin system RelE/ParE family toxin n=1 Tax=Paracoccus siganidrum TaxID=1276757 RepID=UPI001F0CA385|nr:type II toxin-antitoxin system RelE/ParE family toxin [Paracoccus siganidrum]
MIEIRQTDTFREWLLSLRDARAKQKIASRIQRLRFGNPGDVKPVGAGVSEMRITRGRAIGSISFSADRCWSCFCAAAPRAASRRTLNKRSGLPQRWRVEHGTGNHGL